MSGGHFVNAGGGGAAATATPRNVNGDVVARAPLVEDSGKVRATIEARGLTPGFHGFHIHAAGNRDPATAFMSAGGHLNSGGAGHADHAGDMPSRYVNAIVSGQPSAVSRQAET
jgi:Cu-Zn family superoxide dismutase